MIRIFLELDVVDLVLIGWNYFKEYNQSVQLYDIPFFQVIGKSWYGFVEVRSDELG